MRKTWQEKLEDKPSLPKILRLEKRFPCYNAVHKMGAEVGDEIVLVNPSEVMAVMKQLPQGRLVTIVEICKQIGANHGVKACCSLTAGIFIMTVANAVAEAVRTGGSLAIPYWRTLKADGFLNEKYPGGEEAHKRLLEAENYRIIARGKRYQVADYEKHLVKIA
jgi:alkylated DNA nucleotide flippase Atl1